MKITGKVLNVKDGDAIIIQANKNNKDLLIVIDGGKGIYGEKVVGEVEAYCTRLKKEAPDLIICTHYDTDHVEGLITLVKYYKNKIKQVWMHQPQGVLLEAMAAIPGVLERIGNKNKVMDSNEEVIHMNYLSASDINSYRLVLEAIKKYKELLNLIEEYNIPTTEPFAGKCSFLGWEEINVIGPTEEYFNEVFPKGGNLLSLLQEEYSALILESVSKKMVLVENPCDLLKSKSVITNTNKASVIVRFDCENGKYLFTGDAGIKSLESTVGYPESISGMSFLKIPHHGSNNNMSKALVDLINPRIAYNSGNNHEDPEVIGCLRRDKNRIVKTTKEEGDLSF